MKRYLIISVLVFCIVMPALAQNWHEADSLRKALVKTGADTARANILLKLAEFEIFKPGEFKPDLDSAAAYIDQSRSINKKISSTEIYGHIVLAESHLVNERGQKAQGKALNEKAIQILNSGTDKYQLGQAYLALADYYSYYNTSELAKRLAAVAQAANAFKNAGHIEREAYAYKALGELDTNDAEALKHLRLSLALYQSFHYKLLQSVYDAMGATYLDMLDYKEALNYELTALKIAQSVHDTTMQLCEINNHIGITYFELLDNTQAVKYFKAALHTAEAYKDIQTIYLLTVNICEAYMLINHPREVLTVLQQTLNKYPTTKNAIEIDCVFTASYLEAYDRLKQYNLAKPYCDHLENTIANNRITRRTLSEMYKQLIKYFLGTKQYSRGLTYLMKNDTLSHQLGIATAIAHNNEMWFELDTAQHNYKAAVYHRLLRDKIHDSTFTATKSKQIRQLQVQFDTKQKEDQINFLNQKAALQQSNLNRANLEKNVTIGGIVLLLIIAGLLYRQARLRKRNNKTITCQNALITHKNELLQNMVAEKEWLLKEVNHRVKNNLQTVISLLESQAIYLENDALKAMETSKNRIFSMSLIHQKLYQSDDVKTIDMSVFLPELVNYLRDSFDAGKYIHFNLEVEPVQLSVAQAVPLALVLNEAITNSVKYAFPGNRLGEISIKMWQTGENIELIIRDNGVGMAKAPDDTDPDSLGLKLMRGLIEEISGQILFENNHGTIITIAFKIDLLVELEK
jgi:two-component sensor histidine kinase